MPHIVYRTAPLSSCVKQSFLGSCTGIGTAVQNVTKPELPTVAGQHRALPCTSLHDKPRCQAGQSEGLACVVLQDPGVQHPAFWHATSGGRDPGEWAELQDAADTCQLKRWLLRSFSPSLARTALADVSLAKAALG